MQTGDAHLVERRRAERAVALDELVGRLDAGDRAAIAAALPALTRPADSRGG